MCDDLGVPMAPEKTMGPSSVLCFAGIEQDTNKMSSVCFLTATSFSYKFQTWLNSLDPANGEKMSRNWGSPSQPNQL